MDNYTLPELIRMLPKVLSALLKTPFKNKLHQESIKNIYTSHATIWL